MCCRTAPSRAAPSRAAPSRANPSRANPSRAERSRTDEPALYTLTPDRPPLAAYYLVRKSSVPLGIRRRNFFDNLDTEDPWRPIVHVLLPPGGPEVTASPPQLQSGITCVLGLHRSGTHAMVEYVRRFFVGAVQPDGQWPNDGILMAS